jgi:hypothetical protein
MTTFTVAQTPNRTDQWTVTGNGWKATLTTRKLEGNRWAAFQANTRVFGLYDTFVTNFSNLANATLNVEDADERKAAQRRLLTQAAHAVKPFLRTALVETVYWMNETGTPTETTRSLSWTKAKFSREASCGCGCSPGHVLEGRVTVNGTPADVWFEKV